MANDRRYTRYFIILENEDRGFEKADKRVPKGYAKIEVRNGKGLLNVYVQDLKYFKDAKYIYRNYLISTKGDKSVFVDTGAFVIDEKGKGELKVKFNPDDVEGSRRTIEDFNVVAVIAKPIERSSEQNEVFGPLVGYIDKEKINWKDVVINANKEPEENDELDDEYKEKYEEIIDVIEKSSKELYKEDAKENKDNNEKPEKKEEKKDYKKEYKDQNKKYNKAYYEDEKKECDDCVDSLEKYDNKKMKVENNDENKENVKAETKKEEKKEINNKSEKYENKKEANPKANEQVKEESKIDKKQKDTNQKEYENKENIKEEAKENKKKEEAPEAKKKEKAHENDKDKKKEDVKKADTKKNLDREPRVHYKKYHKMVYKYVKDILKYYEKIEPFERNIQGYSWWKIPYNKQTMHRGFLPFFGYILSSYYFNPYIYYMNNCQNLMNKYGHYIFGVVYDKDMEPKYYVYGVPGRYMYMDQPFQGMTGFVSWHPLEDKNPEQGDYGYWLLYIDAKTGNVVFPISPTVPPR
ncbi:hypothetical protein [Wukongibacter sp. M2B1]|uniref:hypothetical protein n=1 Tax=Wukongibacter sp. M2B1 TaxID=3088895 RepID=UPI003D78D29A